MRANMRTSMLTLNEDVLATLVSYLDPSSARRLSYTARAIHVIAKHRALQSVTLRSVHTTIKFCRYMLEEMAHRVAALHELRVHCIVLSAYELGTQDTDDTEELYAAGAALLTDLLRGAAGLRVLVMDSAQAWMGYEPQMVDALCSIQTLREVELELVGSHVSEFINKTRSAPRQLTFRRPGPPKRTRGRLQLEPQLCMPSVESLLAYDPDNLPEPTELARAFPGTKRLDLRRTRSFSGFGPRRSSSITTVAWPTLERVRGSVFSFEKWKNVTPVHLLQLVGQLSSAEALSSWRRRALAGIQRGQVAYSAAVPIVDNFQPVALILELDASAGTENLEQLVRSSARLQYLAVAINDNDYQTSIEDWWATFCSVLANTSIVCLELRVACDALYADHGTDNTDSSVDHAVILKRWALMCILEASAHITPSTLRYLSLDCSPAGDSLWSYDFLDLDHVQESGPPRPVRWWRLEGVGPARVATVLEAGQGERIAAHLRSVKYDYSKPLSEDDVLGLR